MDDKQITKDILELFIKFNEWFPSSLVVLGEAAIFLHNKKLIDISSINRSVFFISQDDYIKLADLEEIIINKKLNKSIIIKKDNEFDIYVENKTDLPISFSDILSNSKIIDGIRVASLEHLQLLKNHNPTKKEISNTYNKITPIRARMIAYRTPVPFINQNLYKSITLDKMCELAGVKKRITSDSLPDYFYSPTTDENHVYLDGKYAGTKSIEGLPSQEYHLRLLEIFAYSFLDYAVRECVCSRGYFKTPYIDDLKELKIPSYI